MVEVLVAGAILAISLSIAYGHLARARVGITAGASRATAISFAQTKADELACDLSKAAVGQVWTTAGLDVDNPGFEWRWTVADSGVQNSSATALGFILWSISVDVRYPTLRAGRDDVRDGVTDGKAQVSFQKLVK